MNSEINILIKDSLRLNFLKDLLNGQIKMTLQISTSSSQDYASEIHKDQSRVQVYGKYNLSEDPTGANLTIRPVGPDCALKIQFSTSASMAGKTISLVRSATKTVEREFDMAQGISCVELVSAGKAGYILRIDGVDSPTSQSQGMQIASPAVPIQSGPVTSAVEHYSTKPAQFGVSEPVTSDPRFADVPIAPSAGGNQVVSAVPSIDGLDKRFAGQQDDGSVIVHDTSHAGSHDSPAPESAIDHQGDTQQQEDDELRRLEKEIAAVEYKSGELAQKKKSALIHLEKIEAEYKKDYAALEVDIEEVKSRMKADASIIEHYKDQDITPIETLLQEIYAKLEEAETQIRVFIEAKQKMTMEIESEIKMNKK